MGNEGAIKTSSRKHIHLYHVGNDRYSEATSRYYKQDKDVEDDVEIQAYLNEVSLSGNWRKGRHWKGNKR
ncbi:hypothetical protein OS493_003061 [Desmophyllum pertusum]|uniref:Uncharacterized protein n=1 Tax=Desmophyllum pertusum TaxID=174260 RepID=A0A9X0CH33_9CNID|nr:hypothetical protein OS493_003061 [Desmophyllum pertusum]